MEIADVMVTYALKFIGIHYRWGGRCALSGFDCSGLIMEVLRSVGKAPSIDMSSQGLYMYFTVDKLKSRAYCGVRKRIKKGTIIFFGKHSEAIRHIAIALDENHMIEAANGNQLTRTLEDAIRNNAFVKISPVNRRKDLFDIINLG